MVVRRAQYYSTGSVRLGGFYYDNSSKPTHDYLNYNLLDFNDAQSFTRSTQACWEVVTGTASVNSAVRFWDVNKQRVLTDGTFVTEGTRTNEIKQTEDFTITPWSAVGSPAVTGVLSQSAPDATIGVTAITWSIASTEADVRQTFSAGFTNSVTASLSVWAKPTTAASGTTFNLLVRDKALNVTSTGQTASLDVFNHFALSIDQGSGGNGPIGSIRESNDANNSTWEFWGAQYEQNAPFPSSFIMTTTSASARGTDNLILSSPNLKTGRWSIDFWPEFSSNDIASVTDNYYVLWQGTGSGNWIRVNQVAGSTFLFFARSNSTTSRAITFSRNQKISLLVDFTGSLLTVSGATTGTGSYTMNGTGDWTGADDTIYIGRPNVATSYFYGRIGRPYLVQ